MTEQEKQELRLVSNMRTFNFFLDDFTKYEVLVKLRESGCDTAKGSLSALIRVLLSEFAQETDPDVLARIVAKIQAEYTFTTKRNKRSTM